IAAAYVRYGHLPRVGGVLYSETCCRRGDCAGILEAGALCGEERMAYSDWSVGCNPVRQGVNNLLVLVLAAVLAVIPIVWNKVKQSSLSALLPAGAVNWKLTAWLLGAGIGAAVVPFSLTRLFLTFLKIGSVLFGSGYVLLAFLRSDFVVHLHWLTEQQLLDSVAVGQVTPGPVFT